MLFTVVMILIAGFATVTWLGYLSESYHAATRDRARIQAFYAAEAGVEAAVDFFNNPANYLGENPENYDLESTQPTAYPLIHPNIAPANYDLFEPYIVSYGVTVDGDPLYKPNGELVITRWSFFRSLVGSDATVSKTSKIPTSFLDLSRQDRLVFRAPNGTELSRVESIELIHPADLEAAWGTLPANMRIVCQVRATGITPEGVRSTVESLITENPAFAIVSPGGLLSRATVEYNGNFNIYWGEVWARDNVFLASNWEQKMPRLDPKAKDFQTKGNTVYDTWFRFRTTEFFRFGSLYANGAAADGSGYTAAAPITGTPNFTVPYDPSTLVKPATGKSAFEDFGNMLQKQQLQFPEYSYSEWKNFVTANNFRYFYSDPSNGTLWGVDSDPGSPSFNSLVERTYDDWLGISPSDPDYKTPNQMVTFIDSIPVDDGGNFGPRDPATGAPVINSVFYPRNPQLDTAARMATLKLSGRGLHSRGAIFLAAHLDTTGQGNPPRWQDVPDVVMPNFQQPIGVSMNIFHNGFLYTWGRFEGSGNRTVYGSIYAERGYGSSGSPNVYYNIRMADGSWLNLNTSRVNRTMWNVVTP